MGGPSDAAGADAAEERDAMRQTLMRTAGSCLFLAACAGGASGSTAFAPSPANGLHSGGYRAPEIDTVRAPAARTASQLQAPRAPAVGLRGGVVQSAQPVRIAQAKPAAPAEVVEPTNVAPEVPPAPARDWSAARRAPLPDLDEIVITREETRLAAAPPTRSVLPEAQRPAPAPAPAAAPARAPSADGAYALHLASYRQAAQAEAGWLVLTRDHPSVLRGLAPSRAAVDLPEQGRFHRLLAGPLAAGEAAASCAAMEAEGGYCAVVPWGGTRL